MTRGEARDWPTVDPSALRSISDCRTWEDLDYFIVARASMMHTQVMMSAGDDQRDVATMVPSYYSTCTIRRQGSTLTLFRFVPPLGIHRRPFTFGRV